MSAPRTDIDRQKTRHVGPIVGITAVVVFALGLLVWWLGYESATAPGPQGTVEESVPAGPVQTMVPGAPGTQGTTGTPAAPGVTPGPAIEAVPVTPEAVPSVPAVPPASN